MLKALTYFYEVKGNDIQKANGGIGIIPYCYNQAFEYYYNIFLSNQQNKQKDINMYIPKVVEIHIPVPQKRIKKKKIFTFLDEEEVSV